MKRQYTYKQDGALVEVEWKLDWSQVRVYFLTGKLKGSFSVVDAYDFYKLFK